MAQLQITQIYFHLAHSAQALLDNTPWQWDL